MAEAWEAGKRLMAIILYSEPFGFFIVCVHYQLNKMYLVGIASLISSISWHNHLLFFLPSQLFLFLFLSLESRIKEPLTPHFWTVAGWEDTHFFKKHP
jgi:hypothetical protein